MEPHLAFSVPSSGELVARPWNPGPPQRAFAASQAALRNELLHRDGPHESNLGQETGEPGCDVCRRDPTASFFLNKKTVA